MNIIFLYRVNDGWDIAINVRIMDWLPVFIAISPPLLPTETVNRLAPRLTCSITILTALLLP